MGAMRADTEATLTNAAQAVKTTLSRWLRKPIQGGRFAPQALKNKMRELIDTFDFAGGVNDQAFVDICCRCE